MNSTIISPKLKKTDRYCEQKEQGEYGAPLLKGSERRLRACMRKQEGQIRLSLTLNRDAIT